MSEIDFEVMKMDPELKARWLEWLRDPENKQTTGALRRIETNGGKRYCCLGGLCELHPDLEFRHGALGNQVMYRFPWTEGFKPPAGGMGQFVEVDEGEVTWLSSSYVPLPVAVKMGINNQTQMHLAHLNDSLEWSFAQIADWVEEHM